MKYVNLVSRQSTNQQKKNYNFLGKKIRYNLSIHKFFLVNAQRCSRQQLKRRYLVVPDTDISWNIKASHHSDVTCPTQVYTDCYDRNIFHITRRRPNI